MQWELFISKMAGGQLKVNFIDRRLLYRGCRLECLVLFGPGRLAVLKTQLPYSVTSLDRFYFNAFG